MNRLTQKSQEALHDAQTKALRFGHTEVDGEHLLLALLDQPDGLIPRLVRQAGADADRLRAGVEAELERRPSVSGPGAAPGQVYLTQRLSRVLGHCRAGGQAAQGRVRVSGAPLHRPPRRGHRRPRPDGSCTTPD